MNLQDKLGQSGSLHSLETINYRIPPAPNWIMLILKNILVVYRRGESRIDASGRNICQKISYAGGYANPFSFVTCPVETVAVCE